MLLGRSNLKKTRGREGLLGKWMKGIILILILVLLLSACGQKPDLKNETIIRENFKTDKDLRLGSLDKNGWQLNLGPDSFGQEGEVVLAILSEEESEELGNGDFEFYARPIELNFDGEENLRLGDVAKLEIEIPKEYREDLEAESLFFATYYDGEWDYSFPKSIDLDKGIASLDLHHFSFWSFGKPSEEDQIREFAKRLATLKYESENSKKALKDKLEKDYDDLFKSMGVNSSSIRSQLTVDMISYLEHANIDSGGLSPLSSLANMAAAVQAGKAGEGRFRDSLLEFTGKALLISLEKNPEKFSSIAKVTGGLSRAAGALVEGDTRAALEGIADALRSNPMVALADSLLTAIKEEVEEHVSIWEKGELEKAYRIYSGQEEGRYGYPSDMEGKIDLVLMEIGGGSRAFERNIIRRYCNKRGLKEEDLTEKRRKDILKEARYYLEKSFIDREKAEEEIEILQKREEEFIGYARLEGLLSPHFYKSYFGLEEKDAKFDIGDRLKRIYAIRETVLALMDEAEAEKISDEFLVKAMSQWILWNDKGDREGFFKYMRDMGLIKEPYKEGLEYAWVLVDTIDYERASEKSESLSYSYSYARGSYGGTTTYVGEQVFTYKVGGSLSTQVSFSGVPSIIRPDKPVVLNMDFGTISNDVLNLRFTSSATADFDEWDLGLGTRTVSAVLFQNKDKKTGFTIRSEKEPSSHKEKLTAQIGPGYEPGEKKALRLRYWFEGASMGTNYVYMWKTID